MYHTIQRRPYKSNPSATTTLLLSVSALALVGAGVAWYMLKRKTVATATEQAKSRDYVDPQAQGRAVTLPDGRSVYVPNRPAKLVIGVSGTQLVGWNNWSEDTDLGFLPQYTLSVGNPLAFPDDEGNTFTVNTNYLNGKLFLSASRADGNDPPMPMKWATDPTQTLAVVGDMVEAAQAIGQGREFKFIDDSYTLAITLLEIL